MFDCPLPHPRAASIDVNFETVSASVAFARKQLRV
jgi:hypothetical protein